MEELTNKTVPSETFHFHENHQAERKLIKEKPKQTRLHTTEQRKNLFFSETLFKRLFSAHLTRRAALSLHSEKWVASKQKKKMNRK